MNYLTKTFSCVLLFSLTTIFCHAQTPAAVPAPDTTKKDTPLVITGGVDVFYRGSTNGAPSLTSYTSAVNSFQLGMINLQVSKDFGKIGFMGDLFFGPRAQETNYNYVNTTGSASTLTLIKQLYVYYKPTDKLKFTFGNFSTYFGYELIESYNNVNYSTSYIFTNFPFFHTGIKAEYAFTPKITGMIGVFDLTDYKSFSGHKHVGAQLAYVDGPFKGYLNFLNGTGIDSALSNNTTVDFTGSYQVTTKFGLGLNLAYKNASPDAKFRTVKSTSVTGIAVYANYAVSDKFLLALRAESFDDTKGLVGYGTTMNEFTFSANIKLDALTFIPEIRYDAAGDSKKLFIDPVTQIGYTSDFTYLLAAVYKF